ncbi:hypothetical protein C7212DRAFT_173638 [Tuber magnatum]|uniref:DDE-1 domain-containing protein n=1 Tax=Tuber magnatum TaxID=42249 RepID=A0A317SVU2_9PEZI|nr:hypothetical protein C7212DRAFT_173638 [Tuber magnatum]
MNGRRDKITVIGTICMDSSGLLPMVILKGDRVQDNWFFWNGWTDHKKSFQYLEDFFSPGTCTAIKAGEGSQFHILSFDEHSSHVTGEYLFYYVQNGIIPFHLLAYITHRLQLLDIA